MSKLEDFLNLPDVSEITSEIKMERLGTFTVKPLTQEKHEEFQKRCRTKNRKGEIDFDGETISHLKGKELHEFRKNAQMIFADLEQLAILSK